MDFLWPVLTNYETTSIPTVVANTMVLYALVGDYGILLAVRNILMETYQLGHAMNVLVDEIYYAITDGETIEQAERRRWKTGEKQDAEKKDEENVEISYKNIPFETLNTQTFNYEIVLCQMLHPGTV